MSREEKCVVYKQSEPIDALCTNKSRTLVAIAGRLVLQVFSIHDTEFQFKFRARRVTQNSYISLSWNCGKENIFASSLVNGAVLVWDIMRPNNPERQYRKHKKWTKVCFSEHDENILLSISRDATIALYDIRDMEPSLDFSNKDVPIKDVQFCVDSKNKDIFVTGDDNGTVRFWDIRNPGRFVKEFIAHTDVVNSISLNPQIQQKNMMATAGRDKFVRIWDWTESNPTHKFSLETMSAATRVSWCPSNAYHVSTCSTDNNIHVWDIRRPFLPFATFSAHEGAVTDISWPKYGTGDRFLSVGKDGRLVMHFADQGFRPIRYANTVALSYNPVSDGSFLVSVPSNVKKTVADFSDPFRRYCPSTIYSIESKDEWWNTAEVTEYLAKNYKLAGGSFDELCKHNAGMAEDFGQDQTAYSWRMIALLASGTELGTVRPQFSTRNGFKRASSQSQIDQKNEGELHNRSDAASDVNDEEGEGVHTTLISGSVSQGVQNALAANVDFFFGVNELNIYGMYGKDSEFLSSSRQSISINSDLSRIRDEAFDLKSFQKSEKELQRIESIVEDEIDEGDILFNDGQQMLSRSSDSSQGIGSGDEIEISTGCHISMWDPLPRIKAILEFYSQMGDVQTTSSICLVLGEKVVDMKLIKSTQVDLWFYAYLEMLERLELWNAAAAFIKMSYRPKINQISNESTFVKMACVKCRAILTKSSTHCKACNTDSMSVTRCSICEQLVRGVWSSCDYCGHGGHTDHMREWFAKFNYCPFIGCGHFCQKTVRR